MNKEEIKELKNALNRLNEIDNILLKYEIKELIGDDVRTYLMDCMQEIEEILKDSDVDE
jgi:hypothetical protein